MRPPSTWVLSLALTTVACADPFPCNRYCWSHQQAVPDLTDEDMSGVPDGRFDMQCNEFFSSSLWYPPLPPLGWYAAEQCLVWLERVDVRELGRGVRISGLDEGEASQSLLAALGIHDGDVLTHVDGASLGSLEAIEEVLLDLPTATAWRLTVARREGSRWRTLEHSITRAP